MLRLDPGETMGGEAVKDEEEADDFLVADDEQRPPERRRGRGREEKERTKARERRRRAVTGRILAGLRRHGGFGLRSRADVNEVVAALARHAGWVVLPDGTTFPSHPQILRCLPDEAINPMVRDGFENQFCSGKDVVAATASL